MSKRTTIICWPEAGSPRLFFSSDGHRYEILAVGSSCESEHLEEAALDVAIDWGRGPRRTPPVGWRFSDDAPCIH